MNIRRAIISDLDSIHILGSNVNEFNVSDEVVTFWPKHILINCINSKTDLLLVAEEDDKIIGFIIINNSTIFKKAIIENIYVLPQFRGQGIAKKLLDNAVDVIGSEYICTLTNNEEAISFYKANGFRKGKNLVWLDKVISEEFRKS